MRRKVWFGRYIPTERDKEILDMYRGGATLEEIGGVYDLTRERIRQVLKTIFGITGYYGPSRTRGAVRNYLGQKDAKLESDEKRMRRIAREFGCHEEIAEYIQGERISWSSRHRGPAWSYFEQKNFAKQRGIKWSITLPQWWNIWQESGKYALRGRERDKYVMSRYGDEGPYSPDNVYITTQSENIKDYYRYVRNKGAAA